MKHLIASIAASLSFFSFSQVYTDTAHFEDGRAIPFFFEDFSATPPKFNTMVSPFVVQVGPNVDGFGGKIREFVRLNDKFIVDGQLMMSYFNDTWYGYDESFHLPYYELSTSALYRVVSEATKKKVAGNIAIISTEPGKMSAYNVKGTGLQRFNGYVTAGVSVHNYPRMRQIQEFPENIYYTNINPISINAGVALERIVYYLVGSPETAPYYRYSRIRSFLTFGYTPYTKFKLVRFEQEGFYAEEGTYTPIPTKPEYDLPPFGGLTWRAGLEGKVDMGGFHNGLFVGVDVGTRPYYTETETKPIFRGLTVNITVGGEFGTRAKRKK